MLFPFKSTSILFAETTFKTAKSDFLITSNAQKIENIPVISSIKIILLKCIFTLRPQHFNTYADCLNSMALCLQFLFCNLLFQNRVWLFCLSNLCSVLLKIPYNVGFYWMLHSGKDESALQRCSLLPKL